MGASKAASVELSSSRFIETGCVEKTCHTIQDVLIINDAQSSAQIRGLTFCNLISRHVQTTSDAEREAAKLK